VYGVISTVAARVEMYDAVHAKMLSRVDKSIDGLLVHVGRATTEGFEILEVWESKEHYDRTIADIVFPVMQALAGDQALPSLEQEPETFDVRGLVIPRGNIII
jgi:CheY-like chemotaxis protein